MTILDRLEAEAIHILREGVAQTRKPVMMYSIGKDSSVLLHLARKAFHPMRLPMPLLHVDTGWKFADMITFRDHVAASLGLDLLVHRNKAAAALNTDPFADPSGHTDLMKTQALRQALDAHGFDAAFGGARRDEEASRAKERIYSLRAPGHRWDARRQRPEPWDIGNCQLAEGETLRIFPLSNWTERDVWHYIARETIPIVDLYFAKLRPVIERRGALIMRDDARMTLQDGEALHHRMVRFRTLGCYPLTGAVESEATDLAGIIAEMEQATTSERQGRVIDHDPGSTMEMKKQDGYF
jgi:sulfate adenylyltransferase subunit 2